MKKHRVFQNIDGQEIEILSKWTRHGIIRAYANWLGAQPDYIKAWNSTRLEFTDGSDIDFQQYHRC